MTDIIHQDTILDPETPLILKGEAADDLVEAIVRLYSGGTWLPSNLVAKSMHLKPTDLEGGFFRTIDISVIPARLQPPHQLIIPKRDFWYTVLDIICSEAQKRSFANPEKDIKRFQRPWVKNMRVSHTREGNIEVAYFNVDTSISGGEDEMIDSVKAVLAALRNEVRHGVISVLSDGDFMRAAIKTATVQNKINRATLFQDEIRRLQVIRDQVEKPADREKFLSILRQAAQFAGYNDVTVELLSVEDAFFHGCEGLYKNEKGQGTVYIPMSIYGTDQLVSLPKAFDILGHELGHHERQKSSASVEAHDLDHNVVMEDICKKLRCVQVDRTYNVSSKPWGHLPIEQANKERRTDRIVKIALVVSILSGLGLAGLGIDKYQGGQRIAEIESKVETLLKSMTGRPAQDNRPAHRGKNR